MPVQGAFCPVFVRLAYKAGTASGHRGCRSGRSGWHHRRVTTTPAPGPGTAVEERTDSTPDLRPEAGDSERFSHYVPRDKLMEAMVNGTPVRALCGKVWTPSRDPKKYPVCPECKELFEQLPPGEDRDPDR